jgi:light-regulated signal transduction histidine kinase (bacteriophytochrome)
MGQLIDGILAIARIGQGELQLAPVDLSAAARAVLDDLRRLHPERAVEARVEPGLVERGDPRLLTLVLQNLLDNAWKFTRGRDPALIEVGGRDDAGGRVYFVRDNGAGFDPAYSSKLFGTFQRLHHASEFEGHGIGLASVKRVVERHGGRVWAEGVEGGGATFYFTLGAGRPESPRAEPTEAAGVAADGNGATR